jgi:predicted DNA-binding ribbon-helix-helix protein
MKRDSVRTSLDIPISLHQKLHEVAARRGCSVRQLILAYMERLVAEELYLD